MGALVLIFVFVILPYLLFGKEIIEATKVEDDEKE